MLSCPAAEMVDGSEVLYLEQVTHLLLLCCTAVIDVNVCFFSSCLSHFSLFPQAFWRTPQKPFRQVCISFLSRIVSCLIPLGKIIVLLKSYASFLPSFCFWFQRLYMVKPCPKELKCDVEVRI